MFAAGSEFELRLVIENRTGESLYLDQYLLLDIQGLYFFYPGWSEDPVLDVRDFAPGFSEDSTILEFTWPAAGANLENICFWLGYCHAGTAELVGEVDLVSFDYLG